jgi:alpha-L-fucosidase
LVLSCFSLLGGAQSYDQKIDTAMRKVESASKQGLFSPSWNSLENHKIPKWYESAKFGIFIHWGIYSVPAYDNEWYSRNMYQVDSVAYKHHVATYGPPSKFGYKDFIPRFTAEKFDAHHWAELFHKAGAKYVVPVAEHHDGFAMYDNSFGEWNATTMGPKRDVIAQLAKAVRSQGLHFGLSSHRAEHYWFFDGGRKFDSDVQDPRYYGLYGDAIPQEMPPSTPFLRDWLARSVELVDKYNPELVYFDWWIGKKPEYVPYLQQFAAYYYNQAAKQNVGVVLNYKEQAFPENTAVLNVERGHFADMRPRHWQTDTSISWKSWCYLENDDYKSPESLVQLLVDVVSKNGNLLLNVGPKADGTMPQQAEERLLAIGRWLRVNGEAIFDTHPWKVFGEGPTQPPPGAFKEGAQKPYTSEDIRFTTKGKTLYAAVLKWPEDGKLLIKSLPSQSADTVVHSVSLLGFSSRLIWKQTSEGLSVELPTKQADQFPLVLKIVR